MWGGTRERRAAHRKNDQRPGFEADDLRRIDPKFQEPRLSEYPTAVERLEKLAAKKSTKLFWPLLFAGSWNRGCL
jgi:hypothetical protein